MRVSRLATAALGGFLLLALAVDPVLAQSRNVNLIDDLNNTLLYAATPSPSSSRPSSSTPS